MLVICNGGPRTGSTVAYNMIRLIFETKAIGRALGGLAIDHKLIEENASLNEWRVVKTHFWIPNHSWKNVFIVCTDRHPLDIAASLVRKPDPLDEEAAIKNLLKHKAVLESLSGRVETLFLKYEDMFADMRCWLWQIARFLGIPLTACEVAEISNTLSIEEVMRFCDSLPPGGADEVSQWRHGHVSPTKGRPGAWTTVLSPECVDRIRREFARVSG